MKHKFQIKSKEDIQKAADYLTNSQRKTIENLYDDILFHDGLGETFVHKYEYKTFEITIMETEPVADIEFDNFVSILSVVGGKNDEGTAAEVFCRDRRHIAIGKRGGTELLNAKNKKTGRMRKSHPKGYNNCLFTCTV